MFIETELSHHASELILMIFCKVQVLWLRRRFSYALVDKKRRTIITLKSSNTYSINQAIILSEDENRSEVVLVHINVHLSLQRLLAWIGISSSKRYGMRTITRCEAQT